MLDAVHYFLVDQGTTMTVAALSAVWCAASLKLLFFPDDNTGPA